MPVTQETASADADIRTAEIIPFPRQAQDLDPYLAWLQVRFESTISYNPPLELLLKSHKMANGWVSHVPDGEHPQRLRLQVYLRKSWLGDTDTLCVGNIGVAGVDVQDPYAWDRGTPEGLPSREFSLLAGALDEIERVAPRYGFQRLAFESPSRFYQDLLRSRGYRDGQGALVKDLPPLR